MARITAALVKELRDKTGAGMMDCKKALTETGGVVEDSVDWLRKKGLAAAAKKAGRIAAEGLVAVAVSDRAGAVVEVNSETDFVARNDLFQEFVGRVSQLALDARGDVEALNAAALPQGGTVAEGLTELAAKIGENMTIRRAAALEVGAGAVAHYVHGAVVPGCGRIGVVVGLESEGDAERLAAFGRRIAMHVAAASPRWVSADAVDPAALEREREILAAQARAAGKPDAIVDKMVEGRLRKFYEEVALLDQPFVIDGEIKVRQAVEAAEREAGAPISIAGFLRYALGEGVERRREDFAAEVAATLER